MEIISIMRKGFFYVYVVFLILFTSCGRYNVVQEIECRDYRIKVIPHHDGPHDILPSDSLFAQCYCDYVFINKNTNEIIDTIRINQLGYYIVFVGEDGKWTTVGDKYTESSYNNCLIEHFSSIYDFFKLYGQKTDPSFPFVPDNITIPFNNYGLSYKIDYNNYQYAFRITRKKMGFVLEYQSSPSALFHTILHSESSCSKLAAEYYHAGPKIMSVTEYSKGSVVLEKDWDYNYALLKNKDGIITDSIIWIWSWDNVDLNKSDFFIHDDTIAINVDNFCYYYYSGSLVDATPSFYEYSNGYQYNPPDSNYIHCIVNEKLFGKRIIVLER